MTSISDARIKHLELIQSVINRLVDSNGSHKNYCITLVTAVCGLAASLHRPIVALLALVPVIIFAILDAQYLRLERRYRLLYEEVRCEPAEQQVDFRLSIAGIGAVSFLDALCSWSISVFYLPTGLGIGVVAAALHLFP
ncbi:hypothetical protein J5277_23190 [Rhizobium sp. 16-449-1b]|uniref:hypothetical protein n=1 Tax=Rhizobium sp. 16-449-1b TaxID=2819989 RepID=UPI001ADB6975|nr:hypothetical protein [Rhizobium sp. 16-449-1b]MBO9197023.1 hypothetical protein [Rhizobium sp. 16-449-1b]